MEPDRVGVGGLVPVTVENVEAHSPGYTVLVVAAWNPARISVFRIGFTTDHALLETRSGGKRVVCACSYDYCLFPKRFGRSAVLVVEGVPSFVAV